MNNHNELTGVPSIRSSSVPEGDAPVVPPIVPAVHTQTLLAARIMANGTLDVQERHYKVGNLQCIVDGTVTHAQAHAFNPLWCTDSDITVCTTETITGYRDLNVMHALYAYRPMHWIQMHRLHKQQRRVCTLLCV